jgi:hypothetical protein
LACSLFKRHTIFTRCQYDKYEEKIIQDYSAMLGIKPDKIISKPLGLNCLGLKRCYSAPDPSEPRGLHFNCPDLPGFDFDFEDAQPQFVRAASMSL